MYAIFVDDPKQLKDFPPNAKPGYWRWDAAAGKCVRIVPDVLRPTIVEYDDSLLDDSLSTREVEISDTKAD